MLLELSLKFIPERSVILLEEDVGSVERIFLYRVVFDALSSNRKVLYLAVQNSREDVLEDMSTYSFYNKNLASSENLRIEGYFNNVSALCELASGYDVCIIDPFAFLVFDRDEKNVGELLSTIKKTSRKENIRFFLSMDHGISSPQIEGILRSMVDGVICFKEVQVGRRIERYVHIPKLRGYIPKDEMLPVLLTEEGIVLDTRQAIR